MRVSSGNSLNFSSEPELHVMERNHSFFTVANSEGCIAICDSLVNFSAEL